MAVAGNTQADEAKKPSGERIAKVIARSGLCSRREAEEWIAAGRVTLNGKPVTSPALDIGPADTVLVDGRPLPATEPPRLWRYHKPKGRVTTHKDPEGRPTVFDGLPEDLPRLISVGRLDFNTEGLLLLTNDGELARHLELPATGWARRYRVRAHGEVDQAALDALADGISIEGVHYGPIDAKFERRQGANVWVSITLREGKNREIRRVMEHLGLTVNRLIRVSYGPFMLGDLEPGQVEEVRARVLMDQLGPEKTTALGVRPGDRRPAAASAKASAKPSDRRRRAEPASYLRRKPGAAPAGDRDRRDERLDRPEREPARPRLRRILPMDARSGEPVRLEEAPAPRPRRFERKGGAERPERKPSDTARPMRDRRGSASGGARRPRRDEASADERGQEKRPLKERTRPQGEARTQPERSASGPERRPPSRTKPGTLGRTEPGGSSRGRPRGANRGKPGAPGRTPSGGRPPRSKST